MRFKKSLTALGVIALGAGMAAGAAAPANAAGSSLTFTIGYLDSSDIAVQPGTVSMTSATGWAAGTPVSVCITPADPTSHVAIAAPIGASSPWQLTQQCITVPAGSVIGAMGAYSDRSSFPAVYLNNITVPSQGMTQFSFDISKLPTNMRTSADAHVVVTSNNGFQAGSTSTAVMTSPPGHRVMMSGTGWNASGLSQTAPITGVFPLFAVDLTGTATEQVNLGALNLPVLPAVKPAPPVVVKQVTDVSAMTDTITGTGVPGATVTVTDANGGTHTAVVDGSGNWSMVITNPVDGAATATQTIGGQTSDPANFVIPKILASPMVNPLIGAGALLALAGVGGVIAIRRRKAASAA